MVFLCSCGGLIWENRVHVCGQIRCSCGAIKFNGRGHCCGYTPDYSVPPTNWELYSGYRSFDEWMGSTTWGKRSPSLFNTKNQEKCILNTASSMEDIKNLKQTGSFQDYCKSFDFLLTKVILSEEYATSLFVEGLNSDIGGWVKFVRPKTLEEAYEIAKNRANILAIFDYYKNWKKDGDQILSNNETQIDEFENKNEIQETCEVTQEIIVEEVVESLSQKLDEFEIGVENQGSVDQDSRNIEAEMPEEFSNENDDVEEIENKESDDDVKAINSVDIMESNQYNIFGNILEVTAIMELTKEFNSGTTTKKKKIIWTDTGWVCNKAAAGLGSEAAAAAELGLMAAWAAQMGLKAASTWSLLTWKSGKFVGYYTKIIINGKEGVVAFATELAQYNDVRAVCGDQKLNQAMGFQMAMAAHIVKISKGHLTKVLMKLEVLTQVQVFKHCKPVGVTIVPQFSVFGQIQCSKFGFDTFD